MKKLNFDKINAALAKIPKEMQGQEVQVGYLEGNNYEDGTPVAYVATIHEFGAPSQNIPPRPTMGPTVAANRERYVSQLGKAVAAVQRGAIAGHDALEMIGAEVVGDIKQSISLLQAPALKLSTAERKGFSKPLVDTGQMLGSIQSQVIGK